MAKGKQESNLEEKIKEYEDKISISVELDEITFYPENDKYFFNKKQVEETENIKSKKTKAKSEIKSFLGLIIKSGGYVWDFHKYDSDPWPSSPHGHYKKFKLDVYTGDVYGNKGKKPITNIGRKSIEYIQNILYQKGYL